MKSILEDIAAGDPTGVARCLDEYGGLVWTLADRYLRGQRQEVEDAVQDVFVNIWLAAPKYDSTKGAEASYIATIAHRRLLDHRRRLMSQRALTSRAAARGDAPSQGAPPRLGEEDGARLGEEFSRLPEDEQTAVWLSVTRGLSHREIATATGSPVGTVKTRIRRAMIRLQSTLSPVRAGGIA